MRHLLIAGAIVLGATAASAQTHQLDVSGKPLNLTFLTAQLEEALSAIAKVGGFTIEFDATVTEEMRRAPLAVRPLRFNGLIDELLKLITDQNGLTYTITGPNAVRISKKA